MLIFLYAVNFASLITTNAARHRIAASSTGRKDIELLEFGLRRAQGPDGGLSASKYSYIGGFDGTSNVLAGKLYQVPVKGTNAHSYVMSFDGTEYVNSNGGSLLELKHRTGRCIQTDFLSECVELRKLIGRHLRIAVDEANNGELAAFASYAVAFPSTFVSLIDTYNVIKIGLINFIAVALALHNLDYEARGIRIDSGDLAYLSR